MLRIFKKLVAVLAVAAGLIVSVPAFAADAAPDIQAQWQPRQIRFHYSGFTTYYSCDGIRYKLRLLLRTMGARDIKVSDVCIAPWGAPQLFHDVDLSFSVPVPAKGGDEKGTFPAQWREVQLTALNPLDLDWGDCELVEELHRQILPSFNPRAVVNRTSCIPHQVSVGQPYLRMSLLMPVKQKEI